MKLLVFAGTSEGTDFTERALSAGHFVTVSLATDYGSELLTRHLLALSDRPSPACKLPEKLHILQGRLAMEEIASLAPHFDAIVDATHPYATEVTKNLLAASSASFVPYYRLLRPLQTVETKNLHEFESISSLVDALSKTKGAIFLSTGSRDLAAFTSLPDYQNRLFVRVLPSADSLEKCRDAGIPSSHIIAMQGKFSTELNRALFAEYNCRLLVTKESGAAGGFSEKIAAAEALDMEIYALKSPVEQDTVNCYSSADLLLGALEEMTLYDTLADFIRAED